MVTARLGVGIAHDRARAVLVEGRAVRWVADAPIDADHGVARSIDSLLTEAPLPRKPPPLRVALGPWSSQIKRVESGDGLDGEALERLLVESPDALFLRNGDPLVTTSLASDPTARGAAAFDAPAVEAVLRAARDHGTTVELFLPTPVALLAASADERLGWQDGELRLTVDRTDGVVPRVQARYGSDGTVQANTPVTELSELGDRAAVFADAYGAAVCEVDTPLALRPSGQVSGTVSRGGAVLIAIATFAFAGGLLAPAALSLRATGIEQALDQVRGPHWPRVLATQTELAETTERLALLARHADRPSMTVLLSGIARRLPDGVAVIAIDWTGSGDARLEVLAPNAAELVARMADATIIERAVIDGPIDRQVIDERAFEHAWLTLELGERP